MKTLLRGSLFFYCLILPLLAICQESSVNNGDWESDAVWSDGTSPGLTNLGEVTIGSYVIAESGISFANTNSLTLTIDDTLIVHGDITFNIARNGNTIIVNDNAILIVLGDVKMGNNTSVVTSGSNSVFAVDGTVDNGDAQPVSFTGDGNIYTSGSVADLEDNSPLGTIKTIEDLDDDGFDDVKKFIDAGGRFSLPIELSVFDLSQEGSAVRISWMTASERNTEKFEIYRSDGTVAFQKIGTVPAVGNSKIDQTYALLDPTPSAGTNYYYLKSIDFDGYEESFDIRAVDFVDRSPIIYPNPSSDGTLYLPFPTSDPWLQVKVSDLQGRAVMECTIDQKTASEWESGLAPGHYMIRLSGSDFSYFEQIIVSY